MKNEIRYSPEALNDLDEIYDYIITDLLSPQAALHTVNTILDDITHLEDFSEMGAPLSTITTIESDYRVLISGNYMTFYRAVDQEIFIDRILYSKRHFLRILFPEIVNN